MVRFNGMVNPLHAGTGVGDPMMASDANTRAVRNPVSPRTPHIVGEFDRSCTRRASSGWCSLMARHVDGLPPSAISNLDLGSERLNRPKILSQLKLLKGLGRIPLVVISRGIGASDAWEEAQDEMADLSTSSRHVIAEDSDHWIQLRQPDVVIRQILTVLHTIRRHV